MRKSNKKKSTNIYHNNLFAKMLNTTRVKDKVVNSSRLPAKSPPTWLVSAGHSAWHLYGWPFFKWNFPGLAAYFDKSAVYFKTFWQSCKELLNIRINECSKDICQSLGMISHWTTFLTVCHFWTDSRSSGFSIRLNGWGYQFKKKIVIHLNGLGYVLKKIIIHLNSLG